MPASSDDARGATVAKRHWSHPAIRLPGTVRYWHILEPLLAAIAWKIRDRPPARRPDWSDIADLRRELCMWNADRKGRPMDWDAFLREVDLCIKRIRWYPHLSAEQRRAISALECVAERARRQAASEAQHEGASDPDEFPW